MTTSGAPPSIAVVIPARNEERLLPDLLESLRRQLEGTDWRAEIVVADNGSTDQTAAIAERHGARVVDCGGSTVGEARNRAVRTTTAEALVFLDADMVLAHGWSTELDRVLVDFDTDGDLVVGGSIAAPPSHGWVGTAWFPDRGPERRETRHVGSGHMVLLRRHFDSLGGFDTALHASEDYDFCCRTLDAGGRIVEDNALAAYHQGAPRSIRDFARRELWHGGAGNIKDLLKQRVTFLAAVWALMHLALLFSGVAGAIGAGPWSRVLMALSVGGIAALLLASVWRHEGRLSVRQAPALLVLFYVYYWCRAAGLLRCLMMQRQVSVARRERL